MITIKPSPTADTRTCDVTTVCRRAAAVLLERACLSGHPAPRREAGATVTQSLTGSLGGGGPDDNKAQGGFYVSECSRALTACDTATGRLDPNEMEFVAHALSAEGFDASEDGTGRGTPLVPVSHPFTLAIRGRGDGSSFEFRQDGTANALLTLAARAHPPAIAFNARQDPDVSGAVTHPLDAADIGHGVLSSMRVRRLTPRESERLQGFPDDYTLIPYRGKPAVDGPRYKALGNSFAVNVVRWIGRRIHEVDVLARQA